MLKKTVNYVDFDGNNRTEDLYFNLTRTELIEVAMDLPEAVNEVVGDDPAKMSDEAAAQRLLGALGGKGIIEFIKKIVLKSYGIKSADGRRFEKSEAITTEFSQTLAYDTVMTEMLTNETAASNFINAVIPSEMVNKIAALPAK